MNGSIPRAFRPALTAALVALALPVAPRTANAQQLRRAFTRAVDVFTAQLAAAVYGSAAEAEPAGPPPTLRRCGALYDQDVRKLAEGPELARSYTDWINGGVAAIERSGGLPLPVCFGWRSDSVDTNLARTLLHVNNVYMQRRLGLPPATELERQYWNGYVLTGHTDRDERDTLLARGRAESIQARSPGPPCRFVVRIDPREMSAVYQRKVTYSYQPAVRSCPRAPH